MHVWHVIEIGAVVVMAIFFALVLFEPPLRYRVEAPEHGPETEEYLRLLAALCDAQIRRSNRVEVLTNGSQFYEAEVAAIRAAKSSVHLEAFIFHPSVPGDKFIEALTERAKAGVKVKVVVDYIGSFKTPNRYFDGLRAAGGKVMWYQPIRWYTLKRFNNRTHRELLVIDGRIGFIGGAGIANYWWSGDKGLPPWRDAFYRVSGELATGVQSCFAENWLEASSEVLSKEDYFPRDLGDDLPSGDDVPGFVVISSPSPGRSTRNRILFQMLLASARKSIDINSPYFLPDRSAQAELIRAVRERGVRVRVIVPGKHNNHPMTRLASRRRYGKLLEAGVEMYEYEPGMIHTKTMIVDGIWVAVGSTNYDSRSFDLNDEVNLAAQNVALAARVAEDFTKDLSASTPITFEKWKRRPLLERIAARLGWFMERQE